MTFSPSEFLRFNIPLTFSITNTLGSSTSTHRAKYRKRVFPSVYRPSRKSDVQSGSSGEAEKAGLPESRQGTVPRFVGLNGKVVGKDLIFLHVEEVP